MGGKKTTIPMKKIEAKNPRAVAFSKRRKGLYSKASKLCLLSDAQLAILATPVSSNSNVSFYSFGHSSVDSVVSAFLADQSPHHITSVARKKQGLGFWWEDENLPKSENLEELSGAVDAISSMLQNLKGLRSSKAVENQEDLKRKDDHQELEHNLTLDRSQYDVNLVGFVEDINQIVAFSDNNNNNNKDMDVCSEGFTLDEIFEFLEKSEGITTVDDASANQKMW